MNRLKSIAPKKSLGQNFLIDKNISNKIVNLLKAENNDILLEIGPGTGALTSLLLEKEVKLFAIEYDARAVETLSVLFPQNIFPNFSLIHQDILKFDINNLFQRTGKKLKIIGNIPYYLSSEILFYLYRNSKIIEKAVIMLQKEFAERLVAAPRTKEYGILTVANELVAKSKLCFNVSNSCFFPKPKVTSSVVEINFIENQLDTEVFASIMKVVKAAFNQRRKTLRNSLRQFFEKEIKLNIDDFLNLNEEIREFFTKRPEELTKDQFIKLSSLIYSYKKDDKSF
ncbi:MAG TPA: 16S rRNA (adenine(1518)-N(6)/adenine(1519)-N(6))-dimethyltransferase RsmA [Candidatus Kapabacteria bacterium]|nr:16S rRNA (adenine(1518)-N(6)/adenine(1519)-N(6))-dimethyltransferase RsmA [Candidatus Kapabacteria bacterium]HPO64057.1 16S rRNA (adenine(1518)-N(6)/adenine(1519)-N(6))-dimethyltransferase RsmA [Candidatus Kapabacteria bacterium]